MCKEKRTRVIRYCVVCGVLFLLAVACWLLLWRLDFVRAALGGVQAISDDYVRSVEFFWLGGMMVLTSGASACLFVLLFFLLEKPMLGPRPPAPPVRKGRSLGWAGSAALGVLTLFLLGRLEGMGVYSNMYGVPVLFYGAALYIFCWRLSSRRDYFPPKEASTPESEGGV